MIGLVLDNIQIGNYNNHTSLHVIQPQLKFHHNPGQRRNPENKNNLAVPTR